MKCEIYYFTSVYCIIKGIFFITVIIYSLKCRNKVQIDLFYCYVTYLMQWNVCLSPFLQTSSPNPVSDTHCKKWVSPPPRRAPRCSAAPVMGSLKASRPLSIPHLSPDPRIRSASPASFRVRWDVCFSLFLFFCFSSPQDMITPLAGINLFSNVTWQLGLQSLPDPFLGVWWVFLHKGGLRDTVEVWEAERVTMKQKGWWRAADSLHVYSRFSL